MHIIWKINYILPWHSSCGLFFVFEPCTNYVLLFRSVIFTTCYVWMTYMYNSWPKEHIHTIKHETGSPPDLNSMGSNPCSHAPTSSGNPSHGSVSSYSSKWMSSFLLMPMALKLSVQQAHLGMVFGCLLTFDSVVALRTDYRQYFGHIAIYFSHCH